MFKDPHLFWKNFRLGTELQIAGSFIYNAVYALENMETFYYEEECFEFFYKISVGLERLQKTAVILIEHDENQSQEEFEKSLITHNNLALLNRVKKKRKLNPGKQHNKFLALSDNFYNSARYDRYNLSFVHFGNTFPLAASFGNTANLKISCKKLTLTTNANKTGKTKNQPA